MSNGTVDQDACSHLQPLITAWIVHSISDLHAASGSLGLPHSSHLLAQVNCSNELEHLDVTLCDSPLERVVLKAWLTLSTVHARTASLQPAIFSLTVMLSLHALNSDGDTIAGSLESPDISDMVVKTRERANTSRGISFRIMIYSVDT